MPAPEACMPAFAPDPRRVTKVPNAPVSNSLGLKKLGGGVTWVEDPTGKRGRQGSSKSREARPPAITVYPPICRRARGRRGRYTVMAGGRASRDFDDPCRPRL